MPFNVQFFICSFLSAKIDCGAQILQIFESWAHHLSEEQFITFAKVIKMFMIDYHHNLIVPLVAICSARCSVLEIPSPRRAGGVLRQWGQCVSTGTTGHEHGCTFSGLAHIHEARQRTSRRRRRFGRKCRPYGALRQRGQHSEGGEHVH